MNPQAEKIAERMIGRVAIRSSLYNFLNTRTILMDTAPSRDLLPNYRNRNSFWKTAGATEKLRRSAKDSALIEKELMQWKTIEGPLSMFLHVGWPYRITKAGVPYKNQRIPDTDALATAHKPALDGYVDAGILYDDDQVESVHTTRSRDVGGLGFTICLLVPYLDGDIWEPEGY